MGSCRNEMKTIAELVESLETRESNDKNTKIVIPRFQRGIRWSDQQRIDFMDSVFRGFPIGSFLFYEKNTGDAKSYILADGLQRATTLKIYHNEPTKFLRLEDIEGKYCISIAKKINLAGEDGAEKVRSTIYSAIKKSNRLEDGDILHIAFELLEASGLIVGSDAYKKTFSDVLSVLATLENGLKASYKKVEDTNIPIIIYSGEEDDLIEIFARINSKGEPLTQYDIYAATWPMDKSSKRKLDRYSEIVHYVDNKYRMMEETAEIDGTDLGVLYREKLLSPFEYVFGLEKYLFSKFNIINFKPNLAPDVPDGFVFELLNACFNDDSSSVKTLYENLSKIDDWNLLTDALSNSMAFVSRYVEKLMKFKANQQKDAPLGAERIKLLHSKYQIISLIASVFREMYGEYSYKDFRPDWSDKALCLQRNIEQYYIYDIINKEWEAGGQNKVFKYIKAKRYLNPISDYEWATLLNRFYEDSISRKEIGSERNIAATSNAEYVILNCIYMHYFTVADQLDDDRKFDVEHIAPRKMMLNLLKKTNAIEGLPISFIGNLCYLPSRLNKQKKDKTVYQWNKLSTDELKEVEQKYILITRNDLAWAEENYTSFNYEELKANYLNYCNVRWNIFKKEFCKVLGISDLSIEQKESGYKELPEVEIAQEEDNSYQTIWTMFEKYMAEKYIPAGNRKSHYFTSSDYSKGYVLLLSHYIDNKFKYTVNCSNIHSTLNLDDKDITICLGRMNGPYDKRLVCLSLEQIINSESVGSRPQDDNKKDITIIDNGPKGALIYRNKSNWDVSDNIIDLK